MTDHIFWAPHGKKTRLDCQGDLLKKFLVDSFGDSYDDSFVLTEYDIGWLSDHLYISGIDLLISLIKEHDAIRVTIE